MFTSLKARQARDADYPARAFELQMLTKVLDGSLYDALPHDFHTEKSEAGEYIPLRERRPSVRYALCKAVVDDTVSLLFSDGHFPAVECADAATRIALTRVVRDCGLKQVMIDAATKGAVGSVAIRLRVLANRLFFDALPTCFLTPEWRADAPDTLARVTEKYKVKGRALMALGYAVATEQAQADFWFQRVWDDRAETWFLPWPVVVEQDMVPQVDEARTVAHGLGFVPLVWVRNLPGGDGVDGADGACTFADAINTNIEIDYLLSQAGRGLKYSADPTLLIKEPAVDAGGRLVRGAGNAITVGKDGDAKLLEINGTAASAVIDFVRCLRELALESIHGNRLNADKLSVAHSGRAMELMNQALVWLADRLRVSYGEGALLELLQLVLRASEKFPLVNRRGEKILGLNPRAELSLRWPDWFEPTEMDRQAQAGTLVSLVEGGLMAQAGAARLVAERYGVGLE